MTYASVQVGGHTVLMDVDDLFLFLSRKWRVNRSSDGRVYLRATTGSREYFHRAVCPYGQVTDHRNGNTLDDRRSNLRPASRAENARNCRAHRDSLSGVRGVKRSGSRWRADIFLGGRNRYLGSYGTKAEAAEAYARASREAHGEFSPAWRGA